MLDVEKASGRDNHFHHTNMYTHTHTHTQGIIEMLLLGKVVSLDKGRIVWRVKLVDFGTAGLFYFSS